jgi:hypothetical protein
LRGRFDSSQAREIAARILEGPLRSTGWRAKSRVRADAMIHRGACGRWREHQVIARCGEEMAARPAVHAVALDTPRTVCRAYPAGELEDVGPRACSPGSPAARSATISRQEAER